MLYKVNGTSRDNGQKHAIFFNEPDPSEIDRFLTEKGYKTNLIVEIVEAELEDFFGKPQAIMKIGEDFATMQSLPEVYGYRLSTKSEFAYQCKAKDALKQADDLSIGQGGYSWVIWDPMDDEYPIIHLGDHSLGLEIEFSRSDLFADNFYNHQNLNKTSFSS